ncbi:OmpA family protein [Aurantibacter crassamenti]|nr:OmpA family protein [Aurantibacter crassamenti]
MVTGSYSKDRKRDDALKKLKRKGFAPGSVQNPKTGLSYVYIEYQSDWKKAIEVCTSNFDDRYTDQIWVMQVKYSEEPINLPEEDTDIDIASSSDLDLDLAQTSSNDLDLDYNEPTPTNTLKENVNKSKLIQKADYYFEKMWYAEAAELYEEALLKGDKNYSTEIIQKAADSYYYNTNMEKAYEWYNILYENHGKDLSANNIFKYAHTLKGTGKYGRSKRLMRLYNKKVENDPTLAASLEAETMPNEVLLDNILATVNDNVDLKNLSINTEYSEFSPMFLDSTQVVFASAQDSSFFNTRKYKWNDQPYLDLYVAKLNEESHDLKDAIKFSKKINTKYHEASVAFSPDNTTMYFTRNNYGKKLKRDINGINNLKIYRSTKVGDEWSEAVELPFDSDDYSTGHPALSPDGKQLYFISDMPGTIGETDLFVVDVLENNTYSEPRNLGPEINTDKREMFPFFNGKKLYFSSDGHTGLGGLDVFEATYNEEDGFGEPTNIGQPINSNKDDFSYIVDEESHKGFFASNREGGKGDDDIYSFENLVLEEVPTNINAIAGVVTELITGNIMPKTLIELLDENNIKLKEIESNVDGSFIFEDLDSNTKYNIRANKNQYFESVIAANTTENDTITTDIALKRLEELIAVEDGIKKLKTEMIHFDFDKSYIRTDAAVELDKMVAVMNEYPNMVIKIESHTDSRGPRAYNEYLSDKRAKSSRDYLIKQGIAPERIESAIGYGESRLINECDGSVRCTEQAHYLNRRSEFIITKM